MRHSHLALFTLTLAVFGVLRAESPDPFAATKPTAETRKERGDFTVKVIVEKDGKELSSYEAHCSEDPDSKQLYCKGVVSFYDTAYWRVRVQADLRDVEYANVEVEVDDMKVVGKDSDGHLAPIEIFSTVMQSRGPGAYQIGSVQEVNLKVVIAKAEQASTGQPATRPDSKSEDSHKPQPESEGRSR